MSERSYKALEDKNAPDENEQLRNLFISEYPSIPEKEVLWGFVQKLIDTKGLISIHRAASIFSVGHSEFSVVLFIAGLTGVKGKPTRKAIDRGLLIWKVCPRILKTEERVNTVGSPPAVKDLEVEEPPYYRVQVEYYLTFSGMDSIQTGLENLEFMERVKIEMQRRRVEKALQVSRQKDLTRDVVGRADVAYSVKRFIKQKEATNESSN